MKRDLFFPGGTVGKPAIGGASIRPDQSQPDRRKNQIRPKIAVADPHEVVLEGLISLLSLEFDVVSAVQTGKELLDCIRKDKPDVVITDLLEPPLTSLQVIQTLSEREGCPKVLFFSSISNRETVEAILGSGVSDFVPKSALTAELIHRLRRVVDGLPATMAEAFSTVPALSPSDDGISQLTARELEVLELVARGMSAKQISAHLGISPRTVECHKYKMMGRLGCRTTAQLISVGVNAAPRRYQRLRAVSANLKPGKAPISHFGRGLAS